MNEIFGINLLMTHFVGASTH